MRLSLLDISPPKMSILFTAVIQILMTHGGKRGAGRGEREAYESFWLEASTEELEV